MENAEFQAVNPGVVVLTVVQQAITFFSFLNFLRFHLSDISK